MDGCSGNSYSAYSSHVRRRRSLRPPNGSQVRRRKRLAVALRSSKADQFDGCQRDVAPASRLLRSRDGRGTAPHPRGQAPSLAEPRVAGPSLEASCAYALVRTIPQFAMRGTRRIPFHRENRPFGSRRGRLGAEDGTREGGRDHGAKRRRRHLTEPGTTSIVGGTPWATSRVLLGACRDRSRSSAGTVAQPLCDNDRGAPWEAAAGRSSDAKPPRASGGGTAGPPLGTPVPDPWTSPRGARPPVSVTPRSSRAGRNGPAGAIQRTGAQTVQEDFE